MELKNRIAIVTGAGNGIGSAIAHRYASAGARVLCADVDRDAAERVVAEIVGSGYEAEAQVCDVSKPPDVTRVVGRAVELGGPHVLVCNAAIQYERTIVDTPVDDWDRVMNTNLKGVYLFCRESIPHMERMGGGSIVNIASVNGFWAEPSLGAYCAAKGGVIALTQAISIDFGRSGIRCNSICPGYIETGMVQRYFEINPDPNTARETAARMHALGRLGRAEEIAAMALFLASDEASFCSGQKFIVDGGLTAGVPG